MPSSAPAPAAASAASAEAPVEEKPKEKTIFTVKLEKFDTAAKAKIIREVKAMMPNMNLVEVSPG
jgi:large subunit ribosomal protein L7/L12